MTQNKKETTTKSASPLLERFLQRTMTDRMRDVDDETLAKAIKTLLYDEERSKEHLNWEQLWKQLLRKINIIP